MLHFPDPLTSAATEILRCCLEISADMARPDMRVDEFEATQAGREEAGEAH